LRVLQLPGTVHYSLRFDYANPLFSDLRVRRALAHALDRDAILKGLAEGLGTQTNSHLHPSLAEYNPNLKRHAYDPDRAKALLEEAGGPVGPDAIRVQDGRRYAVEYTYPAGPAAERQALLLQRQLREVGIEMKPNPVDGSVFTSNYYKPGRFEAMSG